MDMEFLNRRQELIGYGIFIGAMTTPWAAESGSPRVGKSVEWDEPK
jgi:hypothetical protein